jgi:hypothetical protein
MGGYAGAKIDALGAQMTQYDFVIFDTSTLPEYYNDVHNIIALPRDHVVTYDYSIKHVSSDAVGILRAFNSGNPKPTIRVILAYVQAVAYKKGAGSDSSDPIPEPTFATLTRLAKVIAVRETKNDDGARFYIDLQLQGYPFDKDRSVAKSIVMKLRTIGTLPMKTYIVVCPDSAPDALFSQTADDQAFSQVVDTLSTDPSQFSLDTFWRLVKASFRTKSLIPMISTSITDLTPKIGQDGERRYSYLELVDQSTIHFLLQFHRGKEERGLKYRARQITVEVTPKVASDLLISGFQARSFGRETVAVSVPATSSLSAQEARFSLVTKLHQDDKRKDYPYGPQLVVPIKYHKRISRSIIAILSLCVSSGLFAWAAFTTSVFANAPAVGYVVPLEYRVLAVVGGVLATLYAYYLWADDIALDKARRT